MNDDYDSYFPPVRPMCGCVHFSFGKRVFFIQSFQVKENIKSP